MLQFNRYGGALKGAREINMIYKFVNRCSDSLDYIQALEPQHMSYALSRAMNRTIGGWGLDHPPERCLRGSYEAREYAYLGDMIRPPVEGSPARFEILGGAWTHDAILEIDGYPGRVIRTVHSLFRTPGNKGVGRAIMESIIRDAERDSVELVLDAYDDHNLSAFYTRLGFAPYGHVEFNEEYVSDRWEPNDGRPDVKAWYRGTYKAPYQGRFETYEGLLAARDNFLITNNWRQ